MLKEARTSLMMVSSSQFTMFTAANFPDLKPEDFYMFGSCSFSKSVLGLVEQGFTKFQCQHVDMTLV